MTAIVSPSRRFPDSTAIGFQFIKEDGSIVPFTTNTAKLAELGTTFRETDGDEQSASTIFGTWVARGGPAPLGRLSEQWPLTEKGQLRSAAYTPLMSPQAQCVPTSAPWLMAYSAPTVFQQLNDQILFKSDWLQAARTIYMDGRGHPPDADLFPQGHSVGRWEGDTLVVETTNFSEIIYGAIANGSQKQLIERFALSEDGKNLNYTFVMEDPEYLVGQVSGEISFDYRPDLTLENLECNPGVAQRFFREFQ